MTDLDPYKRFRTAGQESPRHLWPKIELYRRKQREEEPFFAGQYLFEKKASDLVPDLQIRGDRFRWIEFVAGSKQNFREKTRQAQRLGFDIYWVFHVEYKDQITKARDALAPDLKKSIEFGIYDPENNQISLGTPITFDNYEFVVEDFGEFIPDRISGYRGWRVGLERKDHTGFGFGLGTFQLEGFRYRLLALGPGGLMFGSLPLGDFDDYDPWEWPSERWLKRKTRTGDIVRLGPAKMAECYRQK